MGNHDYEKNVSDPQSFGEIMNRINLHRGHAFRFGGNASYGFFDLPSKERRILFLTTGDGSPYGFCVPGKIFAAFLRLAFSDLHA